MSIELIKGQIVAPPPSGIVRVTAATDGTLQILGSDGATAPLLVSASASQAGSMSAANYTKLNSMDDWHPGVLATMRAAFPQLTAFSPEIKIGTTAMASPIGTSGGLEAAIPGGGFITEEVKNTSLLPYTVFQTPKTTSWALAFRAKITNDNGFNFIGLMPSTGSHNYGVAFENGTDATKYLLYSYNGTESAIPTTLACDSAWHSFVVGLDASGTPTLKLYIDGTLQASSTTLTRVDNETCYAGMIGTAAGAVTCARMAFGYVAP